MPQSLSAIYVHAIFHVKSTSVAIQECDADELCSYIAGVLNKHDCNSVQVGCARDHVHLLFRLSSTITLADMIAKVKVASNHFLNAKGAAYSKGFTWQTGYAAFSVSNKQLAIAKAYVASQKEHHKDKCFNEEYLKFLKGNHVDFNEEFIFKD